MAAIVEAEPCSLPVGAVLTLRLRGVDPDQHGYAQCSIRRIDVFEDRFCLASGGSLRLEADTARVEIGASQDLKIGLYWVNEVRLSPTGTGEPDDPSTTRLTDLTVLFEVRETDSPARDRSALMEAYQRVLAGRRDDFLKGFGDTEGSGVREFLGLVVLKDCLLTQRMRVGQYELIPFRPLSAGDQVLLVNDMLTAAGIDAHFPPLEEQGPAGPPTAIAHFPRVLGTSTEDATARLEREADLLCRVLALQRRTSPSVLGGVVLDRLAGKVTRWLHVPQYRGNLLGGWLSGEDPTVLRQMLNRARGDERLQLFLGLFLEAEAEPELERAYFRYWTLLETIARSKPYLRRPKRFWDGTPCLNQSGAPILIADAHDLVFELLRETLASSFGASPISREPSITHAKAVTVWYMHRNHLVHRGGCFPHDPEVCRRNRVADLTCREAHESIVREHGERNRLTDDYFLTLRDLSAWIVMAQFRKLP